MRANGRDIRRSVANYRSGLNYALEISQTGSHSADSSSRHKEDIDRLLVPQKASLSERDSAMSADPLDRALADWQGKIAVAAKRGNGLDTFRAALNWAKQYVPLDNGLCEKAKQEIRDAAERHLADTHGLAVIDAIYGAVFPEEVRDDVHDNNKLDACAIKIDDDAEIKRLAKLDRIEYARARKL